MTFIWEFDGKDKKYFRRAIYFFAKYVENLADCIRLHLQKWFVGAVYSNSKWQSLYFKRNSMFIDLIEYLSIE